MVSLNNSRDVLELARSQLDFAAIAAEAPASKEILFKAQTMVPLNPAKPWKRIAAAASTVLVVALVALAPWLPDNSNVSLLKITFEQSVDYQDAYRLISHFAREVPDQVLLGAEMFSPMGLESRAPGHLAIRLSSVRYSPAQLQTFANGAASGSGYSEMYQILTGQINVTNWLSPASHLTRFIGSRRSQAGAETSQALARSIRSHEAVFTQGLEGQLNQIGYHLLDLEFLANDPDELAQYDFIIDCWPAAVGINVQHYADLMDQEQVTIQQRAEDYLETVNLRNQGLALISEPQLWLPIVVEVHDGDGRKNPQLTSRIQAWVSQPEPADMANLDFDALDNVRSALDKVVPRYECRLDFVRNSGPTSNATRLYKIKVTITGVKERDLRDIAISNIKEDVGLEY